VAMSAEQPPTQRAQCIECGFEAPVGDDEWDAVDHPPLGTVTRCPECGSTDVHTPR
jgi:predicted Zn-ribbon and HTH transcriptional regulator